MIEFLSRHSQLVCESRPFNIGSYIGRGTTTLESDFRNHFADYLAYSPTLNTTRSQNCQVRHRQGAIDRFGAVRPGPCWLTGPRAKAGSIYSSESKRFFALFVGQIGL